MNLILPEEKRIVFTSRPEFRINMADGASPNPDSIATLEGYALRWNVTSLDRGGYKVRLAPGSAHFSDPTFALWSHLFEHPVGNTSNNTLRLFPDSEGVRVQIDLPNTSMGRDALVLVNRRDVQGMSFSMTDLQDYETIEEGDQVILVAKSFTVDEVTICANPAFVETTIEVAQGDGGQQLAAEQENSEVFHKEVESLRLKVHRSTLFLHSPDWAEFPPG